MRGENVQQDAPAEKRGQKKPATAPILDPDEQRTVRNFLMARLLQAALLAAQ